MLCFAIDLGIHGEVGSAGQQGICLGNIGHSVVPIYRVNGAHFLFGFFGTGKNQKQQQARKPISYHMFRNGKLRYGILTNLFKAFFDQLSFLLSVQ
jgi:hypothetical protein